MKEATIVVTKVTNGYIIKTFDEYSNEIESRIATSNDVRGYSHTSLATVIENMFDKFAVMVKEQAEVAKVTTPKPKPFAELIDEVDSDVPF